MASFVRGMSSINNASFSVNRQMQHCLCREEKDEFLIHCEWGQQCGGWVHPSCVGFEGLSESEALKFRDFVCLFCRADGVSISSKEKLYLSYEFSLFSRKVTLIDKI